MIILRKKQQKMEKIISEQFEVTKGLKFHWENGKRIYNNVYGQVRTQGKIYSIILKSGQMVKTKFGKGRVIEDLLDCAGDAGSNVAVIFVPKIGRGLYRIKNLKKVYN